MALDALLEVFGDHADAISIELVLVHRCQEGQQFAYVDRLHEHHLAGHSAATYEPQRWLAQA